MAELDTIQESGFFNYDEQILEEQGIYDRSYDAADFANFYSLFFRNGVFADPANQLMVNYIDDSTKRYKVLVKSGWAFIDGYWYHLKEDVELDVPVNTEPYTRYVLVLVRLNKQNNKIELVVTALGNKTILVSNNAYYHEMAISQIAVRSNDTKLYPEDFTDLRPTEYCGFVTGAIDQIDASEYFNNMNAAFNEWFNQIKGNLSTDAAGNLQLQINELKSDKVDKSKILQSTEITEPGFLMDGKTASDKFTEISGELSGKQKTITGGASTIASSNLTASRVLVSNSSGKVAASSVTSTQLGYLSGAKGNIQNQIDNINSLKGKNGDNVIQFLWGADMTCTLYVDNVRIGNLNYTK